MNEIRKGIFRGISLLLPCIGCTLQDDEIERLESTNGTMALVRAIDSDHMDSRIWASRFIEKKGGPRVEVTEDADWEKEKLKLIQWIEDYSASKGALDREFVEFVATQSPSVQPSLDSRVQDNANRNKHSGSPRPAETTQTRDSTGGGNK